ncbi:MAG: thioredoxin family protein [Bacteroidaceae bacterium]|nr:thioredoxin family protein [Bacteroidaceae bacterium]
MILSAFLSTCLGLLLSAPQFFNSSVPVKARESLTKVAADTVSIHFTLDIAQGWHVYSTSIQDGGPVSAEIRFDSISGASPVRELHFTGDEKEQYDAVFDMNLRYFENKVTFIQDFVLTAPEWHIEGALTYGACNDESCLPPQYSEFNHSSGHAEASAHTDSGYGISQIDGYDAELWKPVSYPKGALSKGRNGLLGLLLTSFIGGLIALLTPCVWPIIPMTVSFFLKRSQDRKSGIRDAILYGFFIITVYVTLGLIITLVFGANALNSLATNAIVNIVFFLVLVVFALSFFGLFEITLPSGWSTGTDRRSTSGGIGGIFFMALTLTIVSFSCTGPIIGFLLVDAASSGNILAPTVGMLGFSMALAIPFALFAMFPGWLKSLPRSGGWMDKVKVTLGFVELAFALKFLSVADMAYGWGILPRDIFILLWIIMALMLGLYLLGLLRFRKNENKTKPGTLSIVLALASFLFAAVLIPGLRGAPLKGISAFTPPMSTQLFGKNSNTVEPQFTDYDEALKASSSSGKPVMIDFTGYGCVNCRKMEAAVWSDPQVARLIRNRFILVSLYVDDKTPLPKPVTINENGSNVKIRTTGDKWSLLQRYKFGANAQPFYVITDSEGRLKAGPYTFDTDVKSFLSFLESGL